MRLSTSMRRPEAEAQVKEPKSGMSAAATMEEISQDGSTSRERLLKAAFDNGSDGSSGDEPEWLRSIRESGMAHFTASGFPTQRMEEWRFTNIALIREANLVPPGKPGRVVPADVEPLRMPDLGANALVFVDGFFAPEHSRIFGRGPRVTALSAAIGTQPAVRGNLGKIVKPVSNPLAALNTAFWRDGAAIVFAKGEKFEEPVHLLFLSTGGTLVSPRVLVVAEPHSEGSVVESFYGVGEGEYWTNAVTEFVVGDGARVEHTKFQCEATASFHTASIRAHIGRDAYFTSHSIALGARISRNDIATLLEGKNSTGDLNGLYICRGTQLCDHHTMVDHAVANCGSHEFYHGILDERSRGVFNGKIFVRKDAQKTDAKQTNRGLLLSADALIDTKPQLEIFADDVKCTHGATIGRLDKSALYYLRARGIAPAEAGRMLTHAFAGEIIDKIAFRPLRDHIDKVIFDYLEGLPALR